MAEGKTAAFEALLRDFTKEAEVLEGADWPICARSKRDAKVLPVATDEVLQMRGCSLMVKPQSSKLITRVRFPSSPPPALVAISAERPHHGRAQRASDAVAWAAECAR